MSSDDKKRLRGIMGEGPVLPKQRRSRAPRGFHDYATREPEPEPPEDPDEVDEEIDEDAVTASLCEDELPPPRFATLFEGFDDRGESTSSRARRLRAGRAARAGARPDPDPPAQPATEEPPPRPPMPPEEVLRIIDAELDREAIVSADANFVESGLLFGHQCSLRDTDGNEIFIWSSNAAEDTGYGGGELRFFVATDAQVDGAELSPDGALRLGTLLRAVKTQVEVSGEDAFDALVQALLHYDS